MIDQKKRLLYDKQLKAYYDPETGQYFEMKAQLIPQSSLGQLEEPDVWFSDTHISGTKMALFNAFVTRNNT